MHMAHHGVEVVLDTVDAAGRGICAVLDSYVTSNNADLLVMGCIWTHASSRFHLVGYQEHAFKAAPADISLSTDWARAQRRCWPGCAIDITPKSVPTLQDYDEHRLLALLDDVAAIAKVAAASIDDVASQSAKAGVKAAGVVIDDTAVTPPLRAGFAAERELPIVGKIAAGSLRNNSYPAARCSGP